MYNILTADKLNRDAAKPIFIIWVQAKNDLGNMCYNILETYCTNTPLIFMPCNLHSCYLCLFNKYLFLSQEDRVLSSTLTNSHKIDF